LAKKTDAINRLKVELGEKTAAVVLARGPRKGAQRSIASDRGRAFGQDRACAKAERMLADKQAELAKLATDFDTKSMTADSQRVELVALRAQPKRSRIGSTSSSAKAHEIGDRLDRERKAATTTVERAERGARQEAKSSAIA
jgi:hypothetical protein